MCVHAFNAIRFVISTASIAHAIRFIYHENIVPKSFISTIFKERKIPPCLLILRTYVTVFSSCFSCFIQDTPPGRSFRYTLSRTTLEAVHVSAITARNSFSFWQGSQWKWDFQKQFEANLPVKESRWKTDSKTKKGDHVKETWLRW